MNASFDPSGDQVGDRLDFLASVSWRDAAVAVPLASATNRPSGEISGAATRLIERISSTVGAVFIARFDTGCAAAVAVATAIKQAMTVSLITAPLSRSTSGSQDGGPRIRSIRSEFDSPGLRSV